MNKISQAFAGKKAFIPYLMAGDPSLAKTADFILAMQEAGADLIEIGIPFSDPIAEGEVIQQASIRATGTTLEAVFQMVSSIRNRLTIPVVFMTYINPVFRYGYNAFFKRCAETGVAGAIIPDMPFEEQDELREDARQYDVDLVTLVAPTSHQRIQQIVQNATGFIYLVSSLGVTGIRNQITTDIPGMVQQVRSAGNLPAAVGFGISTPEQAKKYAECADGVIVGSAIVKIIAENGAQAGPALSEYVRTMKNAVSSVSI